MNPEEREVAWLLARERGEPAPPIDPQIAAEYDRLIASIGELPVVTAPDHLSARVLDEVDRRPSRRAGSRGWAAAVGAVVAMAAAAALFLRPDPPEGPRITTEVRGPEVVRRGRNAAVGDTLVVRARVGEKGVLRVYRGDARVARCPGDAACRETAAGAHRILSIEVHADVPGSYLPVVFDAAPPGETGRASTDQAAAGRAGIDFDPGTPIDVL